MTLPLALGLVGLIASPAAAFWRLPCTGPVVVQRADPIVNPGAVSGHVHTIMGGNAFDFTMGPNTTRTSTCSSCTVIGDDSNYWTPSLYYQAQDGTFESVDQVGGATVYYLQRAGDGETLKAFPPGFRMLAGDPSKRSAGTDFPSQAISYNCLDYNGAAKPETGGFPNYNCPDGLRAQVFFPSCWNGKDLDSPDHKSHVSYPANSYNSGSCPPDFPVHLISIFYEVIWDTPKFANQWYGNNQPFVWSMGDPTGYGGHGDFIMGWDPDLLQKAVDTCTNLSGRVEDCPLFNLVPNDQAAGCRIAPKVNEVVTGTLSALPGCNPIQAGPGKATAQSGCGATTQVSSTATETFYTDLTSKGWAYTGCGTDSINARILTGASESGDSMSNENCVAFCQSKGFSVAGTEFGRECYCGNSIPANGAPIPGLVGNCIMPCSGASSEFCGGAAAISLYQQCTDSSCTNAQFGPAALAASSPSSYQTTAAPIVAAGGSASTTMATVVLPSSSIIRENSTPSAAPPAVYSTPSGSTPSNAASSPDATTASSGNVGDSQPMYPSSTDESTPSAIPESSASQVSGGIVPIATGNPTSNATIPSAWSYTGCWSDTVFPRSLPNWSDFNGPKMTNSACIKFCDSRGFSLAGTEYAGQCFCGNTIINSSQIAESSCNIPCTGSFQEVCGGKAALSLYSKSSSSKSKRDAYSGPRRPSQP